MLQEEGEGRKMAYCLSFKGTFQKLHTTQKPTPQNFIPQPYLAREDGNCRFNSEKPHAQPLWISGVPLLKM